MKQIKQLYQRYLLQTKTKKRRVKNVQDVLFLGYVQTKNQAQELVEQAKLFIEKSPYKNADVFVFIDEKTPLFSVSGAMVVPLKGNMSFLDVPKIKKMSLNMWQCRYKLCIDASCQLNFTTTYFAKSVLANFKLNRFKADENIWNVCLLENNLAQFINACLTYLPKITPSNER